MSENKKKSKKESPKKQEEDISKEAVVENQPDPKDVLIEKLENQLIHTAAEYDNYRKRTAKERLELAPDITARVVTEFLPVLDNLERALQAETADENYKQGIVMIHQSFLETLSKLGVEEIETKDVPFDPSCHQAVQQIESEDQESGTICATYQKGYRIKDKVIRFSMVAVVS